MREEIYNLMMAKKDVPYTKVDQPTAKKLMQMAYITFSTISSAQKTPTEKVERSRWADQVTEAANHHSRLLSQIQKGELYETLS